MDAVLMLLLVFRADRAKELVDTCNLKTIQQIRDSDALTEQEKRVLDFPFKISRPIQPPDMMQFKVSRQKQPPVDPLLQAHDLVCPMTPNILMFSVLEKK